MMKGKKLLVFISLTVFILLASIGTYAQVEEIGANNSRLYYTGSLGAGNQIEFNMQVNGYSVSGTYIEVQSGDMFVFKGRLSADKSGMGVLIYDDASSYIASLEAKIISRESDFGSSISGVWKSGTSSSIKRMDLTKVAEFAKAEPVANSIFRFSE